MMQDHSLSDQSFRTQVVIKGSAKKVFSALTTLEGIRAWWTPTVSGSAEQGNIFRVAFISVNEYIVLRVLKAEVPTYVMWECTERCGSDKVQPDEWQGSKIIFEVTPTKPDECILAVQHVGVNADGWSYFLHSVQQYIETGTGTPFVGEAS